MGIITIINPLKENKLVIYKKVNSNKDIDEIKTLSEKGSKFCNYRSRRLENHSIGKYHCNSSKNKYGNICNLQSLLEEVETLFTVLELGVDGIIFETENEEEINKIKNIIQDTVFNIIPQK